MSAIRCRSALRVRHFERLKIKVGKLRGVNPTVCFAAQRARHFRGQRRTAHSLRPRHRFGAPWFLSFRPTPFSYRDHADRSDLLSYVGLAREIAATDGKTARLPQILSSHENAMRASRYRASRMPFYSAPADCEHHRLGRAGLAAREIRISRAATAQQHRRYHQLVGWNWDSAARFDADNSRADQVLPRARREQFLARWQELLVRLG